MVEDLGVEAKEAAVREVAKLLPLPELLQSIASIKADYIARQQVLQSSISVPDQPSFSATFIQLNSIPTFSNHILGIQCIRVGLKTLMLGCWFNYSVRRAFMNAIAHRRNR